MQRLSTTTTGKNVSQLHDEIAAGVPELFLTRPDGIKQARYAFEHDDTTITITIPDDVAITKIQNVIHAHVARNERSKTLAEQINDFVEELGIANTAKKERLKKLLRIIAKEEPAEKVNI